MIFGPTLLPKVLDGTKTMTRRVWPRCLVRVGGDYAVQRGRGKNGKALVGVRLKVTAVRQERLFELTKEDAHREGFESREDFFRYWRLMHDATSGLVWVVTFEREWRCKVCGFPVGEEGICGECACEDDCAP